MLLKLLKYEMKSTYARFLSAFAVYVIVCFILHFFLNTHPALVASLTIVGMISLGVITFVTLFHRYNSNLYGSEGYLMFTLPVNGKKLLLSKLISAFVWIAALIIVLVPTTFFIYVNNVEGSLFSQSMSFIVKYKALTVYIICQYFIQVVSAILSIYFAISISKLPLWRKYGVPAGILAYFVMNFLCALPLWIYHKVSTSSSFAFLQMLFDSSFSKWAEMGFDILICLILFYCTAWLIERKTNLK